MAEKAKLIIEFDGKNFNLLDDANKKVDELGKKGNATSAVLGKAFLALGTAFAGVSASIGKMVGEFAGSETASIKLAQSLKNTGNYSAEAMADLNAFASALQRVTAFEDDSIISAQSLIAAHGYQGQVLKDITKATLDLATAKGMDLASAADLVGKSIGTENNALARYGIEIRGAADSTDRAYSAVKAISDLYGGQALAAGQTFTGQMASLKNQIGDVAEEIGGVFAPIVLEIGKIVRDVAVAIGNFVSSHRELIAVVGTAVVGFLGLAAAISGLMAIWPALSAAVAVLTGPVGWVIGGIVALIAILENWGAVSNWLKEIWSNALSALATAWENFKIWLSDKIKTIIENIKDFGRIAWDVLTGDFKGAFDKSKEMLAEWAESQRAGFDELFSTITTGITVFADGAVDLYGGMKDKILNIINNIKTAWGKQLSQQTTDVKTETTKQLHLYQMHWSQVISGKQLTAQQQMALDRDVSNVFGQAAGLMSSKHKELFAVGKAAAIGQALVNGYSAIVSIWSHAMDLGPIVGPILAGTLTAIMTGVTAANIASISATEMPAAEFGGIVPGTMSGMPVLAGERNKSEAIIPLEGEGAAKLQSAFGGIANVINVFIENMFADDAEIPHKVAQKIDEALETRRQSRNSSFAYGLQTAMELR